jgi:hypothetical protein
VASSPVLYGRGGVRLGERSRVSRLPISYRFARLASRSDVLIRRSPLGACVVLYRTTVESVRRSRVSALFGPDSCVRRAI